VNFNVPQQQLATWPSARRFPSASIVRGRPFEAVSPPSTPRSILHAQHFRAGKLANPEEKLRAGMFAQVEVELPAGAPRIAVARHRINYAPYGNSVLSSRR